MIHYNMRYRGPYEYDKFILNILQYSNDANDFIDDINNLASYKTIKELYDTINTLYNKSTGKNGTSESCYKRLIMFKEATYR